MSERSPRPTNNTLLGWLYGVPQMRRRVANRYPSERLVMASGAMLIHKKTADDVIQRVTSNARRGVFVATPQRLLFVTLLWMPMNIMYMVMTAASLVFWVRGGGLPAAILAAFGVAWLVRRRPYRLHLTLADVGGVSVNEVGGMTGGYHTLIIHTEGASYQVVTTDTIDEEARLFFLNLKP